MVNDVHHFFIYPPACAGGFADTLDPNLDLIYSPEFFVHKSMCFIPQNDSCQDSCQDS